MFSGEIYGFLRTIILFIVADYQFCFPSASILKYSKTIKVDNRSLTPVSSPLRKVEPKSQLSSAEITHLNQMNLQDLCRDMKQTFRQNSLGIQNRLGRLDDRMSAVERMQVTAAKLKLELKHSKEHSQ